MKKRLLAATAAALMLFTNTNLSFIKAADEKIAITDYMKDIESLQEAGFQYGTVINTDNEALITFIVDPQKKNGDICFDYIDWQFFGTAKYSHKTDILIKDDYLDEYGNVLPASASTYCYIKAETPGTIIVKATKSTVHGNIPLYYNFIVDEKGNISKKDAPALPIKGDVNTDDSFSISDAVLLQKWLIGSDDAELANWTAADFCRDGKLDIYDLLLMKKALTSEPDKTEIVTFEASPSYDHVEEFLEKAAKESGIFPYNDIVSITPQDITEKYGFSIYKSQKDGCGSYIEFNDNIFVLTDYHETIGDYFAIADMNADGYDEIYFLDFAGSGIRYGIVLCLDTASNEVFSIWHSEMGHNIMLFENKGRLEVYSINYTNDPSDPVSIKAYPNEKYGEIVFENGRIILKQ